MKGSEGKGGKHFSAPREVEGEIFIVETSEEGWTVHEVIEIGDNFQNLVFNVIGPILETLEEAYLIVGQGKTGGLFAMINFLSFNDSTWYRYIPNPN